MKDYDGTAWVARAWAAQDEAAAAGADWTAVFDAAMARLEREEQEQAQAQHRRQLKREARIKRWRWARDQMLAEGKDPNNAAIAEKLELATRTIVHGTPRATSPDPAPRVNARRQRDRV